MCFFYNKCHKEDNRILHCPYCKRQWTSGTFYRFAEHPPRLEPDIPDFELLPDPLYEVHIGAGGAFSKGKLTAVLFRELEPGAPIIGLYSHEWIVCKACLPRVPDLCIVGKKTPMLRKAEKLRQDVGVSYSQILNKQVEQYLSGLDIQHIRGLTSHAGLHQKPEQKLRFLKEQISAAAFHDFEESDALRNWTEKVRSELISLKEEKAHLLKLSLYERLTETAEDGTNFYRSCQNVPQEAYDGVEKRFNALCPSDISGLPLEQIFAVYKHTPQSQSKMARIANKHLADMDAFLRDRGIDPDTLFSGGSSV